MGKFVDLVQGQLNCSELKQEFNLQLDPPSKVLFDETKFDTSFTTIPDDVPSNIPPFSSPLQYTSSNGTITPVSQQTYSNNLVVTDNSFQGCISRDLVYHPPTRNPSE